MRIIAATLFLSCCAFGQDKTAVSAAEAGCGPQDVKFEVKSYNSHYMQGWALSFLTVLRAMASTKGDMTIKPPTRWSASRQVNVAF